MTEVPTASKGLLAGMAVDVVKARIAAPPYQEFRQRLTRRWREVAAFEAETGRIINIGSCAGGQITWLARETALEHRLTGHPDALYYVGRQIDKLADVFLYHPEQWQRREHPYWSEMHVSLAADLCRGALDEKRMTDLLRMVREHFVKAPYIGWNARDRFLSGHNMTVTEQACAGICALVWGEDAGVDDWEAIVQRAIESCILYCRHGLDRGGYGYEGTMYAAVPMDIIYLFAQLLFQHGRENLFAAVSELKAYPDAVRTLLFPDRAGLAPLADGGIYNPKSYAWLLLTARHYDRPEDLGLWYEYRGPGRAMDPWPNNNPRPFWPDLDPRGPVRRDGWGFDLLPLLWWDADAPMTPVADSPQSTANYSPGAEVATFRTGWSRDAVYLNVSGQGRGHASLDHAHADGGHFTLFAHGDYLAIDTGYWNVYEDQHSVVLIDGQGQFNRAGDGNYRKHYAGRLVDFQRHPLLDYVMADLAHPRNCVWADRHLLFVRLGGDDAYVVTLDNINPDHCMHSYQWQLQAHPESEVKLTGDTTATVTRARARLDVTVVSPPATDFPTAPHEMKLFTDHVYGAYVEGHTGALEGAAGKIREFIYTEEEARREKADLTYSNWYRPRLVAEQSGPIGLILAVISPRRAGAPPLPGRVAPAKRVFRVEIECGEFTDTLIAAPERSLLEFDDIRGYTELALIRLDQDGKLIDYWTVGHDRLLFPGKE